MKQTKEDQLIAENYNKLVSEIAISTPQEQRTPQQQFQLAKELVERILDVKGKDVQDSNAYRVVKDILKKDVNNWVRLVNFCNSMRVFQHDVTAQDLIDYTAEGTLHHMKYEGEDEERQDVGYFYVSALVPTGNRQEVRRMDGQVRMPEDTNRMKVLGAFISRYTDNVGNWVKRNEKTYIVRWVAPKVQKKETQQEFGFK